MSYHKKSNTVLCLYGWSSICWNHNPFVRQRAMRLVREHMYEREHMRKTRTNYEFFIYEFLCNLYIF